MAQLPIQQFPQLFVKRNEQWYLDVNTEHIGVIPIREICGKGARQEMRLQIST